MEIFSGTSGWNYRHWRKKFYPEKLAVAKQLEFYSSRFNAVEVNYTHYRSPSVKTLKSWYNKTPRRFIFSLKAPRYITHLKKLKDVAEPLKRFYGAREVLRGKAACFLFQLPPFFKCTPPNTEKLAGLVSLLDKSVINIIEFRDPSWWNEKTHSLFLNENAVFCSVSGLDMPDSLIKTADTVYIRFHGDNYKTPYNPNEISDWCGRIKKSGALNVFTFFNNDYKAYAPANALELKEKLNEINA
ncbi:MAG: DUF72 domain-containing protein [Fibrobacterota bacterium]